MPTAADPFFEPYDRDDIAYGCVPSAAVQAYLEQLQTASGDQELGVGEALDLGAGAGRDSLALARAGFQVTAVDLSPRGMERIVQRAAELNLSDRIRPHVGDVREFPFRQANYAAIVATTVLDHIPADDARVVWANMIDSLAPDGFLFAEVHTTEDPGSDQMPGVASDAPVSETAEAVINYFAPNQLVRWATESNLRVLRYEERLEWDYTHGAEHLHGKAILLAVHEGYHPPWYGQPAAFPRRK